MPDDASLLGGFVQDGVANCSLLSLIPLRYARMDFAFAPLSTAKRL